ncbi:Protein LONGIFOLIA 2 [Camellia lanceoleosa]|uniref:Protein LONGIFOLIA 2 n=1 Tax=Camellia lanceoleosa TaxID=1840588 RepID=A0ACC0J121_9ERIC|nr:Protein LONGIFOLIA 2 [Camellia lanceoleosa]
MSAKRLYSLTDENPDLHKQVGCMHGLLQLFDRHHSLASRHISSNHHKRAPPGQNGNHGLEPSNMTQKAIEKNLKAVGKEKQRVSVESSRPSFSSSSCSSSTFSSVDCNKTVQPEPSLSHSIFPETPSQILPKKQSNSSLHSSQQSLDLRDVVKDSINRETRGLTVKTTTTPERTSHVIKHVDSPRPLLLSNSVKPKVSELDRSFQVLAKLRESPQSSIEEKSKALPPKDAPRFSYDGRESRDKWKSATKLKELPRLSLDSRERSIRVSASESRSSNLLEDLQRGNDKSSQTPNPQQEPGSNKRPSSVVAKLMGLEAFPDSTSDNNDQTRNIKSCPDEDLDAMSTSSRKADESKYNQVSRSPRTSHRERATPQLRNPISVMKPNSRFPLEPAPWRQPDGNRGSQKPASMHQEAHIKAPNSCPSVYGEIERRLTELEFKRSGKDLRALKQILEAMQKTKERLKHKEEQTSDLEPQTSNHGPNSVSTMQCNHRSTPIIKATGPPMKSESSVVIIKPANVVEKPRNSGSSAIPIEGIPGLRKLRTSDNPDSKNDSVDKRTAKDLTPRNNHFREPSCQPLCSMDKITNAKTYRSTQTTKAPQQNTTGSGKGLTTVSPRLQQRKDGMDKQSHPTTQTSDPSRTRRHLSKQQIESGSPSRKFKPKSPNLQQGNDRLSEISSDTRQSESNISSASQTEIEVTSIDRSKEMNGAYHHKDQKNEIAARLSEDGLKAEATTATLEQPSPVSVLDTTFYIEESPSPVKKISNAFKDDETLNSDEEEWNSVDLDLLLNRTRPIQGLEFDREDLGHLVRKLRQVNSTHDEAATDYIASLCENTNPEHRYIAEIFLASGLLLKDLGSSSTFIQLHPSGHLINPNLFLVLEQTKGRIELPDAERSNEKINKLKFNGKIHRKLIFDTVNETLVHKLTAAGFSELGISPNKLRLSSLTGQKLLEELCSEMDHLQPNSDYSLHDEDDCLISILREDMMLQTQNWADNHSEIPGVVLDIERLIFKDLIGEVVSGEVAGLPGRRTKHCRRLFPK